MNHAQPVPAGGALQASLGMLRAPRRTLREIVDSNPKFHVLTLAALLGITSALDRAAARSAGDVLDGNTLLVLALLGGVISGPITLYVFGFVYTLVGRWFGGKATHEHGRAALAWATVPSAWAMLVWPIEFVVIGQELFTSETPVINSSLALLAAFVALEMIKFLAGLWSLGLLIVGISEVHRFGLLRAGATFLTATGLFLVGFLGLVLVFAIFS